MRCRAARLSLIRTRAAPGLTRRVGLRPITTPCRFAPRSFCESPPHPHRCRHREAEVGDERGVVTAGDLAVIPAMVPHAVRNIGEDTLKVVGFFSEPDVTSTFDEPVQPIGESVVTMKPIPVAA